MSVQALRCEILLHALTDSLNSLPARIDLIRTNEEIHPRDYILVPNPAFELVCLLAGTDPEAVRRDFRERLAREVPGGPHEPWQIRRSAGRSAPRLARTFTYQGRTLTLGEWSEVSGITGERLIERVNRRGWSIERALTEPVGRRMPRRSRADPARIARIMNGSPGL